MSNTWEARSILIVTEVQNHLLRAIRAQLEIDSYQVIMVNAEIDPINSHRENISAILIFTDDKLTGQQQALNYLKDRALIEDIPIFTVGHLEELKSVKAMIPERLIQKEFLRPVNIPVRELVSIISTSIREYGLLSKKSILVVDDSGTMLRTVKGWLEDRYRVFLANSAAMAIKFLALNRPDLILLDYAMPVVDGKQVLEMIRTETEFADIPVIFLTGKEDPESMDNVRDLNPEGYLLKSQPPQEIIQVVDNFFETRRFLF